MGSLLNSQTWDSTARPGAVWSDLALAATLTLTGQLELAASSQAGWHGLAHGVLLLGQTAPVVARRVAPCAAAVVGAGALAAEALTTQPTNTLSGLLAGLVLLYSLGRHASGPRMVAVTVFAGAALSLHMLRLPSSQLGDLAFAVIFSAAAWLTGRTLRRRELERHRAELDARSERAAAAAALDAAVAAERSRIAREMHDIVAHGMGAMVVQAAAAEQLLDTDPDSARGPLTTVRQTGQGALAEMRRLVGLLRDGDISDERAPQPGLDQLPTLVERLRDAGMPLTLSVTGTPADVSSGLQLCTYRIVQEALTNALKHADGATTQVSLDYRADAIALRVQNAGGVTTAAALLDGAGHGLIGMRERVRLYGGSFTAGVQQDGSFLVSAVLPIRS